VNASISLYKATITYCKYVKKSRLEWRDSGWILVCVFRVVSSFWVERQPARSCRSSEVFFVFEHLIYSSAMLNIMDKLWECQRVFVTFFTKGVYKSCALFCIFCHNNKLAMS
jgi:hypothetical protein